MHISYVKEGVFEKDEIMPRVSLQEVGLTIKEKFYDLTSYLPFFPASFILVKDFILAKNNPQIFTIFLPDA